MKKLSEILELAMPLYIAQGETETSFHSKPWMCWTLLDICKQGEITEEEADMAKSLITLFLSNEGSTTLYHYLRLHGRSGSVQDRVDWYWDWIRELKRTNQ